MFERGVCCYSRVPKSCSNLLDSIALIAHKGSTTQHCRRTCQAPLQIGITSLYLFPAQTSFSHWHHKRRIMENMFSAPFNPDFPLVVNLVPKFGSARLKTNSCARFAVMQSQQSSLSKEAYLSKDKIGRCTQCSLHGLGLDPGINEAFVVRTFYVVFVPNCLIAYLETLNWSPAIPPLNL